jgi:hypothetical protein
MNDRTPVRQVHGLWLDAVRFTRSSAATVWARSMQMGAVFVLPPKVAALPGERQRAEALARSEARRLRDAELFYVTEEAARTVSGREFLSPPDLGGLMPAPSGLMVWEEPPVWVEEGMPIRAASWGPAFDGGVWASWWTDTEACVRAGLIHATASPVLGRITYHQEVHFLSNAWPAQADDPASAEYGLYRSLIDTWSAITSGAVERVDPVTGTVAEGRVMKKLGVKYRPVHQLRPSAGGGKTVFAQDIVRQLLEADGVVRVDRPYPGGLPPDLAPWHFYSPEAGHCLFVRAARGQGASGPWPGGRHFGLNGLSLHL